ncbi:hypothetical protein [Helicobacter acinonychis]|uniref:hypothetical protein n=1 Tax=Helicobacter acinonychis TaxID=212 RepID=UPI00349FAFBA
MQSQASVSERDLVQNALNEAISNAKQLPITDPKLIKIITQGKKLQKNFKSNVA